MRALVAIERSMIVSIWNILSTGEIYNEVGADCHGRNIPSRALQSAGAQLIQLGCKVEMTPAN